MTQDNITILKDFFTFLICSAVHHGEITIRRGANELGVDYQTMVSLLRDDCRRRYGQQQGAGND